MNRYSFLAACACTIIAATGCGVPWSPPDAADHLSGGASDGLFTEDDEPAIAGLAYVPDQLLVHTVPGAEANDVSAAAARAGGTVIDVIPEIETATVQVTPGQLDDAARALAAEPVIEGVQKNYEYVAERQPQDPRFAEQDYLGLIGLPDAWDITTGSDDIIAAVLDSGVSRTHPDLQDKILPGWNAYDRNSETDDAFGHGTLVAGVMSANANNAIGLAGVAWSGSILPVRVANTSGRATARAIASGLVWASNRGARVMNVSFAPLHSDRTVLRAARYVANNGGLVFISAGNDGTRSGARGSSAAVFVGATDGDDRLAGFSSTGPFVDISAPGVGIWSTTRDGDYEAVAGTSYASPMVAGVANLIFAIRPELRPSTVEQLLRATATDLGSPGEDESFGSGRVDAAGALAASLDIAESNDDRPPLVEIQSPDDGAEAGPMMRVSVSAVDPANGVGVADVVLLLDGRPVATDAYTPYLFALRTTRLRAGVHTLSCVATDLVGNAAGSNEVRIVVAGDGDTGADPDAPDRTRPTVTISFPIDGATVTGQVGGQAVVTDNLALSAVEWIVDGVARQTTAVNGTRAVVNFVFDADGLAAGSHILAVRVTDESGNTSASSVTVRVP